jgi:hypothetical protein
LGEPKLFQDVEELGGVDGNRKGSGITPRTVLKPR